MTEAIFTPEQLAEIHAYRYPRYVWGAFADFVNLGVALVFLKYLVRPLYARCARFKWRWAVDLSFAIGFTVFDALVSLPAEVYFGYFHEHDFGLSNYTPAAYAIDSAKGFVLQMLAMSALAVGVFGLARRLKHWWAVLGMVGAVVLLFSAGIDPYRARVFFDQKPLPPSELRDRITALMAKANIDFKDVLVEDNSRATVRLGAYFAGTGPTRTIVLNGALIKELSTDEILAAVAHESGHVHESKWPATIASALALLLFMYAVHRVMQWVARRGVLGVTEAVDVRALPLVMLLFYVATMGVTPLSAAFSRARESEADRYAVSLTRDPEAFESMLVKAARVNKMDPAPPAWVKLRGHTHPSIHERLEAIEEWKKTNGG